MNINGTYRSQNGGFLLTITDSNESNGTFKGSYTTDYTPQGKQDFKEVTGEFSYVNNPNGQLTPLSLGFIAVTRPADRSYVIYDSWSGVLNKAGSFVATGTRSYLPAGGAPDLSSLGTQGFNT